MSARTDREPCPWRIVDDAGGAFALGLVGGGIWNAISGARNAPKGLVIQNAINKCKARAPILGGSFALWGAFFSVFDCSFANIRHREDPWNAIMAGAATGGVLALRAGMKSAAQSALAGGVILAAIEGLNIAVQRVLMPYIERSQQAVPGHVIDMLDPPTDILTAKSIKQKSLWDTVNTPAPLHSHDAPAHLPPAASSGFDLDSIGQFDTSTEWKPKASETQPSSSWWKPW